MCDGCRAFSNALCRPQLLGQPDMAARNWCALSLPPLLLALTAHAADLSAQNHASGVRHGQLPTLFHDYQRSAEAFNAGKDNRQLHTGLGGLSSAQANGQSMHLLSGRIPPNPSGATLRLASTATGHAPWSVSAQLVGGSNSVRDIVIGQGGQRSGGQRRNMQVCTARKSQ